MDHNQKLEEQNIEKILQRLSFLEERISRLEGRPSDLSQHGTDRDHKFGEYEAIESSAVEEDVIESQIGEYGMAWLGNIVLLFGILFLVQLFKSKEMTLLSSLFGLASVAGVYLTGRMIKISYPYMSRLFSLNGHVMLFFVTLSMHFSSMDPLIKSRFLGLFLMILVLGFLLYLSLKRSSQELSWMILIMVTITALASNSTPVMLSAMILTAFYAVIMAKKAGWWGMMIFSIFIVYTTFLLWYLNNPIVTHNLQGIISMEGGLYYLLVTAFIYALLALLPLGENIRQAQLNTSIILNGLGFSFILAMLMLDFFKDNYYWPLGFISAFAIVYSAILQYNGKWKISAALYALYGFIILSITIAGIYKFPLVFFLLSIQSLLVVSMALWFRSRFIVLMNAGLFLFLLAGYFIFSDPVDSINISFALVALITARVINWKKNRLEIRTESMRNTYLIAGFFMTLFSLYHLVPEQYVTLSWAGAAALFFIFSILLNNVKYRRLAILTMIITVFYLFLFNLKNVGIGYRIVALLFIAVISLSFSTYYAKRMKNKSKESLNREVPRE